MARTSLSRKRRVNLPSWAMIGPMAFGKGGDTEGGDLQIQYGYACTILLDLFVEPRQCKDPKGAMMTVRDLNKCRLMKARLLKPKQVAACGL
jgi:hypothetical protein